MNGPRFSLDANVLIYALDLLDRRHLAAADLVRQAARRDCVLTVQALGEFFHAATRKGKVAKPAAAAQVARWLAVFPPPATASVAALQAAMVASEAGRFSYWDALNLATAEAAGCTAMVSEDMGAGAMFGRLHVVPAFAGDAIAPEARALLG